MATKRWLALGHAIRQSWYNWPGVAVELEYNL